MEENGDNVDTIYRNGVLLALSEIKESQINLAILQSRSPTCGVNQVYDGYFSGKLINDSGLFATALRQEGYKIVDVEDLDGL